MLAAEESRKVIVAGGEAFSAFSQQLSWDQSNAVVNYLIGPMAIDRRRIIMQYGMNPAHTVPVQLVPAGADGPDNVPPPHPNMHSGAYWRH